MSRVAKHRSIERPSLVAAAGRAFGWRPLLDRLAWARRRMTIWSSTHRPCRVGDAHRNEQRRFEGVPGTESRRQCGRPFPLVSLVGAVVGA